MFGVLALPYLIATATTDIYALSLHDALPISARSAADEMGDVGNDLLDHPDPHFSDRTTFCFSAGGHSIDRVNDPASCFDTEIGKSTRLNSSHSQISYAVFCLKKKTRSR